MNEAKPKTLPPPPLDPAEAAFVRVDAKLDKVLAHVERLTLLAEDLFAAIQEDRTDRQELRDRVSALESIPPRNGACAP